LEKEVFGLGAVVIEGFFGGVAAREPEVRRTSRASAAAGPLVLDDDGEEGSRLADSAIGNLVKRVNLQRNSLYCSGSQIKIK